VEEMEVGFGEIVEWRERYLVLEGVLNMGDCKMCWRY
jgi:hypothetical protein